MNNKAGYKNCPYCSELIKNEAVKCRYCGEFLTDIPNIINAPSDKKALENSDKQYVRCDSCKQELIGKYTFGKDLWGYHKYTCSSCGYSTAYPLGSSYEAFYWVCIIIFILWLIIYLFVDKTASLGILGLGGLVGIPVIMHNLTLKSRHPNCRAEEFNTRNT